MNPKFLCGAPSHVSLHVKCQVVRPGEGALTQVALEGPVSGVFAEMTSQLIGAGEFPSTAFPAAVVRLLTCEDREMGDYSTVLNGETCFCFVFLAMRGCASLRTEVCLFIMTGFTLTGVSSEMCLQVGTLGVGFATASEAAGVRGCALPRPCASSSLGFGLQQLEGR